MEDSGGPNHMSNLQYLFLGKSERDIFIQTYANVLIGNTRQLQTLEVVDT